MATIHIEGLRKKYVKDGRDLPVLRSIDLRIEGGEMISIQGASGAGKSTFLHVLGTLDRPSAGRILFDGVDVFALSSSKLAAFRNRSIGFVFQFHHLLPEFSALENVAMPAMIARKSRAEAEQMAQALLERVGLQDRVTHKPGELSGGEQQRVALARALVMKPQLLLADEPTGNLDVATSSGIHELINELNRDLGITFIVVTHNPSLAATMPRQLMMIDGVLEDA
jgi:lipoprotein-releasing system ATP-binding protein